MVALQRFNIYDQFVEYKQPTCAPNFLGKSLAIEHFPNVNAA